jgi:hypothetical protein
MAEQRGRQAVDRSVLVLACLLAAGGAWAQERPPVAPTRDVMVTYRATAPAGGRAPQGLEAGSREFRVAATQGGLLMRVETMGAAGAYVIVDRAAQRMLMVMPQDRRFIEMPVNDAFARGFVLNEGMTFARRGSDTVASLRCTVWEVTSREGAGTACVTEDGVLLRGRASDGKGVIEATAVTYAAQPAALFRPPADHSRLELPAGAMPGGGPPGQGRPPAR